MRRWKEDERGFDNSLVAPDTIFCHNILPPQFFVITFCHHKILAQHFATTIFCHTFYTTTMFSKKLPTASIDTFSSCENSASVRGGGTILVTIGANCGGWGAVCKEKKAKLGRAGHVHKS